MPSITKLLVKIRTDTGVVSILDSRVARRGYGKQFIGSLPPCKTTEQLQDVRDFFSARDAETLQRAI